VICGRASWVCLVVAAGALVACSSGASSGDDGSNVRVLPRPTTGPYVSVAVDNHFHDIHPEDDVEIGAERTFVVKNQGRNLHNVTILGTGISEDVRPDETFRTRTLGSFLEIGEDYTVVCRFHEELGMTGKFTVVR
jgi:plastocyanin